MQLWIVAQIKQFTDEGWAADWDLAGVFSTEELARSHCTERTDCYWPVNVDEYLGRPTFAPTGLTFPLRDA
jgi:hypothetical protein